MSSVNHELTVHAGAALLKKIYMKALDNIGFILYYKNAKLIISAERRIDMRDDFEEYLEEQLKDLEFRKEYEALEPDYTIMQAIIDARKSKGLTQKELSIRSGIAQGDISKLENGNANPSIRTIQRLATAMGKTLRIEFYNK